jgi:hypothetical protein
LAWLVWFGRLVWLIWLVWFGVVMMVGLFDKIYYATYDCPNKHANLV